MARTALYGWAAPLTAAVSASTAPQLTARTAELGTEKRLDLVPQGRGSVAGEIGHRFRRGAQTRPTSGDGRNSGRVHDSADCAVRIVFVLLHPAQDADHRRPGRCPQQDRRSAEPPGSGSLPGGDLVGVSLLAELTYLGGRERLDRLGVGPVTSLLSLDAA